MPTAVQQFVVTADLAGKTVAAGLRHFLPGQSWSQVRTLIDGNRVRLNGDVARRELLLIHVEEFEILLQDEEVFRPIVPG